MFVTDEIFNANGLRYRDKYLLSRIQNQLSVKDPLVKLEEINKLNMLLKKVSKKQGFIIQAGDCAERFSESTETITNYKCQQLINLKSLLEKKLNVPVVTIGRIAGQYAKPRSSITEFVNGKSVYSYHGDIINSESMSESRNPDPLRMIQAYDSSVNVLKYINQFNCNIFTSHECYLLEYEQPLTRVEKSGHYNLSAHLIWLGMRNLLSEPHIDYLSTIDNPIGLKVGPHTSVSSLMYVVDRLNPNNLVGKIILVIRLGRENVDSALPKLIQAVTERQLNVIWMSDPLHGNTKTDKFGVKYRLVSDAVEETLKVTDTLYNSGLHLGGFHLEASYRDDIAECVSSLNELSENRLYDSALDPRLNSKQSISYINSTISKISLPYNLKHNLLIPKRG